jgi:hypothetical protein
MSIVAQQYNIMAETLRRGIAGFAQQKVQEGAMALKSKQMDYEIEKDKETREMQKFEFEAKKPAMEQARMTAEAENKRLTYEMSTPLSQKNISQMIDVPSEVTGPEFNKYLQEHMSEITGLEVGPGGQFQGYGGKPMTIYDAKNNPNVQKALAFVDYEKMLTGMRGEVKKGLELAPSDQAASEVLGQLEGIDNKLNWIKDNRGDYEARRTDVMIRASMDVSNPKIQAAMQNQLKVQMAREAAAMKNQYSSDGLFSKKYFDKNGLEIERWMQKGNFKQQLAIDNQMAEAGYIARKPEKDSMDQYKVSILRALDAGLNISPQQKAIYNQMIGNLTAGQLAKVIAGTEAGSLAILKNAKADPVKAMEVVNRIYNGAQLLNKRQTDGWETYQDLVDYIRIMYPNQAEIPVEEQKYLEQWAHKLEQRGR